LPIIRAYRPNRAVKAAATARDGPDIQGVHGVPAVHVSMGGLFWLLVLVIGAIGGVIYGRIRGLRHLGEAEFRTRMTNVKKVSRF